MSTMTSFARSILPEFQQEMATTRRLLERVPDDKAEWKPHSKSFALGHLALLVAGLPGWNTMVLRSTELDVSQGPGYRTEKTEALLTLFDQNVREATAALEAAREEDLEVPWSLKAGDRVLMTLPRRDVVRQNLNHLIHHRGQLTVYLRLPDVPLPSIYGPTADERW